MRTILFTKEGYEKVKDEQKDIAEKRKLAVEDLSKARAMGDLSENGYYKAAKFKLVGIDRRIRELTYLIRFGKVTQSSSKEAVGVGSKVVLKTQRKNVTYHIVGEYEADPLEFKISNTSPLGKLLLGKKVGDKVLLAAPKGNMEYEVKKIE